MLESELKIQIYYSLYYMYFVVLVLFGLCGA